MHGETVKLTVNFLCSYKSLQYNNTLTIKKLSAVNIQQNT
jgi:hypothetical protein